MGSFDYAQVPSALEAPSSPRVNDVATEIIVSAIES